jgi:23S rRNA (cytidine1920-2'-O)/16S rRNA (cytidine1409-2'-O)-methyltransferase
VLRRSALVSVASVATSLGATVCGFAGSGLPGPKGNRESFVWLGENGRTGALDEAGVVAAVREVEP